MITLYNVIDIRSGKVHSVVKIKAQYAKWFVPVEGEEDDDNE